MEHRAEENALADELEKALISRDMERGFSLMDSCARSFAAIDAASPSKIQLLLCSAQWIDLGYRDLAFLEELKTDCARRDRATMSVLDFLRMNLVESYCSLAREELESALSLSDLVLRVGKDMLPPHLLFLAHFWKGRVHRKKGEYADALFHIAAARDIAETAGTSKLAAVSKIHESWLVFQKGERKTAYRLLDEAEQELKPTGHGLSLGNIESARGRFIRRSGEYVEALKHFQAAIRIYSQKHSKHPNMARALVNAAYVKRLIALDMKPKMLGGQAKGAVHARYLELTRGALDLLDKAGEIYKIHSLHGGSGSVLVNAGHLHLDNGDTDQASQEALKAYLNGEQRHDQILMSRARHLQSSVELMLSDEQFGDDRATSKHATLAAQYSDEAIDLARHTQNKRLLAEAYIGRGLVAASDFYQEFEIAKDYASQASALLTENDRDHLFKELVALKEKLLRSTGIDRTLKLWSDGQLGGKTFQQVEEEFAELVIPKVWASLGKNVTRVANELSMSPKKVRRILRNARVS
jgi:tetratricopeptide (TPR) repeat protein